MTTITFTGDPRAPGTDPATCELFGIVFPLGEPVEVSDKAIGARLAKHSHFTVGESDVLPSGRMAKARAARAAKKAAQ